MHHNHLKNVLRRGLPAQEISRRLNHPLPEVEDLLAAARHKLSAARGQRPTPYIDRTLYTGWNALCISAYLEAARALRAPGFDANEVRRFALHSLDRLLAEAWGPAEGLGHVIAYGETPGEAAAKPGRVPGILDDYAFTVIACLDAYEVSGDATYFHFAQSGAEAMRKRFEDGEAGGFFDTEAAAPSAPGALAAHRKPFQDAPTPAGNSAAAIALLRLYAYTGNEGHRDSARRALETIAPVAGQFGIYAATYGIAAVLLSQPHTEVVVVGNDDDADRLYAAAAAPFALTKAALRLRDGEAVAELLPPALRETVPALPAVKAGASTAVLCANFTCQPPLDQPEALRQAVVEAISGSRK
jgi:hypothetical protein